MWFPVQFLGAGFSGGLIYFYHVLGGGCDFFSQCLRSEDFYLVAITEDPPGYFVQAINAEFEDGGAVEKACCFLRVVPVDLADVLGNFWCKKQFDVIHPSFGYHSPCPAEMFREVEVVTFDETFIQRFDVFDAVEVEGADVFMLF